MKFTTSKLLWENNAAILYIEIWKEHGIYDGSAFLDLGNGQPKINIKIGHLRNNKSEDITINDICFYSYGKINIIIKQNPSYKDWLSGFIDKLNFTVTTVDKWERFTETEDQIFERIFADLDEVLKEDPNESITKQVINKIIEDFPEIKPIEQKAEAPISQPIIHKPKPEPVVKVPDIKIEPEVISNSGDYQLGLF